jgi:capsule polysaccharide export protein KpsE/RkpR
MSDLMSEQFDLAELYGKSNADDIREELRSRTGLVIRDEGVIVLSVEDGSAERAKGMLDAYLANLDSVLVGLMAEASESRIEFLVAEISRRKSRLGEADSAMQVFQTEYGVYEIEEQARAALEVAAVLSVRYSMLDVEKSLLEMTLKPGAAELEGIRMEWELVRDRLIGLKEGETGEQRLFPPLDELPDLSYRYARLMIEKRVQEFVLAYLQLQKMDAMITANQKVSAIKVLDPPFVPGRRAWPKRKQIVIVSTLSAFFWMCFILVAREEWRRGAMSFEQHEEESGPPGGETIGGEW